MNESIMNISNALVYESKLKCGSEQIAKQKLNLQIHEFNKVNKMYHQIIEPNNPVVFVNLDKIQ